MNVLGAILSENVQLISYIALLQQINPDGPYGVRCWNAAGDVTRYPVRFRDSRTAIPVPDRGLLFPVTNATQLDDSMHLAATFIVAQCRQFGKVKLADLLSTPIGNNLYPYWEANKSASIDFTKQPLSVITQLVKMLKSGTNQFQSTSSGLYWTSQIQNWFVDRSSD